MRALTYFFITVISFCLYCLPCLREGCFFHFRLPKILRGVVMGHAELISPGHVYMLQVEEDRT